MTIASLVTSKPLRLGMSGSAVVELQHALAALGYPLKGAGYFGPATDTAVESFQRAQGMEDVDGIVEMVTALAIDQAVAHTGTGTPVPAVITSRPLWLTAGLALINTKEAPGAADNPQILEWARDEGGAIAHDYRHDAVPWCALFANHCCTLGGVKGTGTLWALDFNSDKFGVKLTGPAVGAFAPMSRAGGGHIAMVVGRDQHGNLMCLGGNQADAVNIKPFPAGRPVSFRWPHGAPLPARVGFATLPVVRSDGRVSGNEA